MNSYIQSSKNAINSISLPPNNEKDKAMSEERKKRRLNNQSNRKLCFISSH